MTAFNGVTGSCRPDGGTELPNIVNHYGYAGSKCPLHYGEYFTELCSSMFHLIHGSRNSSSYY